MLGVAKERKIMKRSILINSHFENIFKMSFKSDYKNSTVALMYLLKECVDF
jgi:hypothetical protein